jgi:hypothetical protein
MRRQVPDTSWLRMMFRIAPSDNAQAFVSLPDDDATNNLMEILQRLQDAERKHSAFAIGLGDSR